MKSPCYKCEDRHEGCHGSCEAYIEWTNKRAELLAEQNRQREIEWAIEGHRSEEIKKRRRKRLH